MRSMSGGCRVDVGWMWGGCRVDVRVPSGLPEGSLGVPLPRGDLLFVKLYKKGTGLAYWITRKCLYCQRTRNEMQSKCWTSNPWNTRDKNVSSC